MSAFIEFIFKLMEGKRDFKKDKVSLEQKKLGRGMGNCDFKYVVTEELFNDAWYNPHIFLCILHQVVVHYLTLRRCCSLYYNALFMKAHGRTFPLVVKFAIVGLLLSNWFLFIFQAQRIM